MFNNLLVTTAIVLGSVTAWAVPQDEIIVDMEQTGKAWGAEIVQSHEVWNQPACSAYTLSDDGQSSLEVIAFYDPSTEAFSEPEVNIVSQADISFLDVQVTTSGSSETFQLLPIQPADLTLVGARNLFEDRQALVSAIRRRNTLTASFIDSQGVVKETDFSLRGSSDAINAQFDRCELYFETFPEIPSPVEVLD